MKKSMLKILIADDHPVVRRGLKQIIAEISEIVVADEATDGWEVLAKVRAGDYDMVLLDITMPGKDGIDVLTQLKSEKPRLPVLVLSMHPEEQFAVRALRAGASGYLNKESAPDELVTAIQKVLSGGKYVSPSLAEELASILQKAEQPPHESLSNREYQVMCLLASGKTVTEIAVELSLSVKTISTYRSRIHEKMRMKNNAELIHYAIKNRLVT
jgi:two-component system, NarL family, invasion response regulator UvrY